MNRLFFSTGFWILSLHMCVSGFTSATTFNYLLVLSLLKKAVFLTTGPMEMTSYLCFFSHGLYAKLDQVSGFPRALVSVCLHSVSVDLYVKAGV